jgi:hypothetical protein
MSVTSRLPPATASRPFTPFALAPSSPAWAAAQRELCDAGVPIPLPLRAAADGRARVVGVRDAEGRCAGAAALHAHPTRALPGHRILRVERFGAARSAAARAALAAALAAAARRDRCALRLHVEAFARTETELDAIGGDLRNAGFQSAPSPRSYERTIVIDLDASEDALFASLHGTARRHVRAVSKNAVELRDVLDPRHIARLDALLRETMERTGGTYHPQDWAGMLDLARRQPELARIVGVFRSDAGPDALLAYAVGLAHGDHVQYATAASTRATDLKLPLGYGPAWELIRWAKRLGAAWFDFGGITAGTHGDSEDPRGGISDFKRYFSRAVQRVGHEWVLEPHPMRSRVAGVVGWVRGRVGR